MNAILKAISIFFSVFASGMASNYFFILYFEVEFGFVFEGQNMSFIRILIGLNLCIEMFFPKIDTLHLVAFCLIFFRFTFIALEKQQFFIFFYFFFKNKERTHSE